MYLSNYIYYLNNSVVKSKYCDTPPHLDNDDKHFTPARLLTLIITIQINKNLQK